MICQNPKPSWSISCGLVEGTPGEPKRNSRGSWRVVVMTSASLTSATTPASWFAKRCWNFDTLQWMRANVNVWWIINFLRWLPVLERWGWRASLAGVAGWWLVCQVGHRKPMSWFLFACFVLWFACFFVFEFLTKNEFTI